MPNAVKGAVITNKAVKMIFIVFLLIYHYCALSTIVG